MPTRLVALDEGGDIPLDRTMVVVGRHPQCDARLDSLRVSRHHCCMTQDNGEVVVRDLGSTNGIKINGQRVEIGRLRSGDELSIAHIRFRLESGAGGGELTLADHRDDGGASGRLGARGLDLALPSTSKKGQDYFGGGFAAGGEMEEPLAAAVREILPAGMADKCRIRVIVQLDRDGPEPEPGPEVAER